ncbi:MAG TPA: hypothetical protein VFD79_01990 [Tissierellaceae bacterium]|nr:hypothetical protein [Tissierellaceae bacterium]
MAKTKLVYGAAEGRSMISQIQGKVKFGYIPRVLNKATHESSYMMNQKIFESVIELIKDKNTIEYDEDLEVYTAYNTIVPQIYGEGATKEEAIDQMLEGAKEFAKDYDENIEVFSGVLNGIQQLIISYILLNLDDENKIREILKVA